MGRTACTHPQYMYSTDITLLPSVPVQYTYNSTPDSALYSTAIHLLPSVYVQYSYTSTPLSTCTVHLYLYTHSALYSTAIPLHPTVPCTVQLYI